ncbi:hypothetical protein WUBG_16900, partial [Wuchereria bancrofti]
MPYRRSRSRSRGRKSRSRTPRRNVVSLSLLPVRRISLLFAAVTFISYSVTFPYYWSLQNGILTGERGNCWDLLKQSIDRRIERITLSSKCRTDVLDHVHEGEKVVHVLH